MYKIIFCVKNTFVFIIYTMPEKTRSITRQNTSSQDWRAYAEGFEQSNDGLLLYSCAQTRWEITNCFHYKSNYIFMDVYLCTCSYESSFIGLYICYLHLKNMHYFWQINIINQTWMLLFCSIIQQMKKWLLGTFMK